MIHLTIEFLGCLDQSLGATFNIEHYTDLPKGQPKPKPDLSVFKWFETDGLVS
jgi:hypothetical protein